MKIVNNQSTETKDTVKIRIGQFWGMVILLRLMQDLSHADH